MIAVMGSETGLIEIKKTAKGNKSNDKKICFKLFFTIKKIHLNFHS